MSQGTPSLIHEGGTMPRVRMTLAALIAAALIVGCGGGSEKESSGEGKTPAKGPTPLKASVQVPSDELLAQITGKLRGADAALRKNDFDAAVEYFHAAIGLLPDAPKLHYFLALTFAAQGNNDSAFAALERAVDLGLCPASEVENNSWLRPLTRDERWPALREKIQQTYETLRSSSKVSYEPLPPEEEPEFQSIVDLLSHYNTKLNEPLSLRNLYSDTQLRPLIWKELNHKLAGLERFIASNPPGDQRYQAAQEILKTVGSYESRNERPWLPSTRELAQEKASWFINEFPEKKQDCAYARLLAARAYSMAYTEDQLLNDLEDAAIDSIVERFVSVDQDYPGTTSSLFALLEAAEIIGKTSGLGDERLAPIVERFAGEYKNHPAMRQIGYMVQPYVLAQRGVPDVEVTDIDGHEWNLAKPVGKATLIDFWATWCKPCQVEIPNLVDLYAKYKDRGFNIIGISLDRPSTTDQETLLAWMKEHEMSWPVVYDRMEWQSPAVKAFGVTGIPFPVLLDESGNVIAAGSGATSENLRKKLAEIFEPS